MNNAVCEYTEYVNYVLKGTYPQSYRFMTKMLNYSFNVMLFHITSHGRDSDGFILNQLIMEIKKANDL